MFEDVKSAIMQLIDIFKPERVLCQHTAKSKKSILENISELFSNNSAKLDSKTIFDAYVAREKLGSTALGHGVAIPHIRNEQLEQAEGAVLLLKTPIDFDAEDHLPVDIIFALMVPAERDRQHLNLLASLSRMLIEEETRLRLRRCHSSNDFFQTLKTVNHAEVA